MNRPTCANSVELGPREYSDYVEALRPQLSEVAQEVQSFLGVGRVLDWMQQKGLDLKKLDFVSQDEFEYDLLLELEPGGRWLAFGVT